MALVEDINKYKTSNIIRDRIVKAGARFHSNDNISEFINEGELEKLQAEGVYMSYLAPPRLHIWPRHEELQDRILKK